MKHTIQTTVACLQQLGAPDPCEEWPFHPTRKWRLDRAWPELMVAWEIEGVTAEGGRHQRPQGYEEDCLKYAEAALLGWIVVRTTPRQVGRGLALALLERALRLRGCPLS